MRSYLNLFLALSTVGCMDATTPDGGQEPIDTGLTPDGGISDAGAGDARVDGGIGDAGDDNADSATDSGPDDRGTIDAGSEPTADGGAGVDGGGDAGGMDDCLGIFGVPCAVFEEGYLKASNTNPGDYFGSAVALSDDGNTLAIAAALEGSSATGINGDQADNSAPESGAVYIFARNGATWRQQAYLKASNTEAQDIFGGEVALSGDGNTLAVGAFGEDSTAKGVDGNQADNSANDSGAVYVFTRNGNTWSQQTYLKASNTDQGDIFGNVVALSDDGNTLAVGAPWERSGATGVNGNQADNSTNDSGAVYIFTRDGTTWSQQAYLKASNTYYFDNFGHFVTLSGDGNTLAVSALGEDSGATGINGDQADNSATESGAVHIFTRNNTTWSQQAYLKASNTEVDDRFGWLVALSGDGGTLAVSARGEESSATGVNGDQADNSASWGGAVYIFTRNNTTWSQQAYLKASNTGAYDLFGSSVALSFNGDTLAVGAALEDSDATGVGGNQADDSAIESGAVYIFTRNRTTWSQQAYIKASNTGADDRFGISVALSGRGDILAVGAYGDASDATGVNGDQANDSAPQSGAVHVRHIAP